MSADDYRFADLEQEIVDEIRQYEQKLSEKSGQAITLIAYRTEADSLDSHSGDG